MNSIILGSVRLWLSFLLLVFITALGPAVKAQTVSVDNGSTATTPDGPKCDDENHADRCFYDDLNLFELTWWERFGSAFEYDFQRVEQPTVLVTGAGAQVPNPEHYLNEHTLKFQFSQLFPPTSTLADSAKSACVLRGYTNFETCVPKKPCPDKKTCASDDDEFWWVLSGGGTWKRMLSGLTFDVDFSERPSLQQGIVVTNQSFWDHYQTTGEIDFDPSQLFLNGTSWGKTFDVFDKKKTLIDRCKGHELKYPAVTTDTVKQCILNLSLPGQITNHHRLGWFAAAIVPTFSFKNVSQFDLLKSGGVLVSSAQLEAAQKQFVVKWSLNRVIPSSASRVALVPTTPQGAGDQPQGQQGARNSQGSLVSDRYQMPSPATKLCVIISGNVRSYINVPPTFTAQSCARFAASTGDQYLLGCVTDEGISVGGSNAPCWKDEADTQISPPAANPLQR